MQKKTGKFTFKVPDGHEQQGSTVEKEFPYDEVDNESEATDVLKIRKWNVVSMVNEKLKSSARSNSYQNALMPYRPSEVSQEDIRVRMIRDYIRMGIPEDVAIAQIDGVLKAQASQVA